MPMSPPLTNQPGQPRIRRKSRIILWLVLSIPLLLVAMRAFRLLIPYSVPTVGMEPAVRRNEVVLAEGISYLVGRPSRGDIIAFETAGIPGISMPPGVTSQVYIKRLVGFPGETMKISNGKLSVNSLPTPIRNEAGEITYTNLQFRGGLLNDESETVTVPEGMCFVLGDNSPNSADSRAWGFVPLKNIIGKIGFRLSPVDRMGGIE